MPTKTDKKTFEDSIKGLELIVRQLEGGELTLDQSLQSFEQGIKLARDCEQALETAKGKVEKLISTAKGVASEAVKVEEI